MISISTITSEAFRNDCLPANLAVGFTKHDRNGNPFTHYLSVHISVNVLAEAVSLLAQLSQPLLKAFYDELAQLASDAKPLAIAKAGKQCDYSYNNPDLVKILNDGGFVVCYARRLPSLKDAGAKDISENHAVSVYHKG